MLLGAALALAHDPQFDRTIHFIFQADEENGTGAAAMIADGLFERFPMAAIYGLHNLPGLAVGQFVTQAGPFCAFEDNFEIAIRGKGGHASLPEVGVDAIVMGSAIVTQLQTIVSRGISAKEHAVVSVTEFESDGARNILASSVRLSGDCRGFDDAVSRRIEMRMGEIVDGVCAAYGGTGEVDYSRSFRPLINTAEQTQLASTAAGSVGTVDDQYGQLGFSEDFAEFLNHCPGAYVWTGNGQTGAHGAPLHNPNYDFNDDILQIGIDYWLAIARVG
jgi:hippurate hydrolase